MEQKEAMARGNDLQVAWKSVVMVGNFIRGKTVAKAKTLLGQVIEMKVAVPFTRFNKDRGHKKGEIAAGRYPVNTAKEVLNLLKSAESNAVNLGMNAGNLVVSRFIGNQGPTSWRYGRQKRRQTKRSHIEIFLAEKILEPKMSRKARLQKKQEKAKAPETQEKAKEQKMPEKAKEHETQEKVKEKKGETKK